MEKLPREDYSRILISNEFTNRLVHKWRSEEASILVGTNTARYDDPALTNRLWTGNNPTRLVIDMELQLPGTLHFSIDRCRRLSLIRLKHEEQENLLYYQVTHDVSIVHQVVNALYRLRILSVLVEGGAKLLQSFIDEGVWDEIQNDHVRKKQPDRRPYRRRVIANAELRNQETIHTDTIDYFVNPQTVLH